jgi:hypothetical protein
VKINGQNPISIEAISVGIENTGDDRAHFSFRVKANQDVVNLGWLIQKIPESSVVISSELTSSYESTSSLNVGEFEDITISIPSDEIGVPLTVLLHIISLDKWVKIPIPYLFQINELDVDTPGSDTEEFLEILAPAIPFASLNGIEITAINGSNESVSRRWNLGDDAHIANEYGLFILAGRDLNLPSSMYYHSLVSTSNLFQNGSSKDDEADAVSINWVIKDLNQSFVIDALIYDTNEGSRDEELAQLLQMSPVSVIEGLELSKDLGSLQRYPSKIRGTKNPIFFKEAEPTPAELVHIQVGSKGSDENQWLMMGVPEGINIIDWIEPSFYTQGALGADIEKGDPIAFIWENGAFSPILDLNQSLSSHQGMFIYVTNLTYGYGIDGWPKPLGIGLNKHLDIQLDQVDIPLELVGEGENSGFNLVANPYPLAIDIQPILESHDEVLELAMWNPVAKQYEVWNGLNGDLESTKIEPYSAFWLKVNAPKTVTFTPNILASAQKLYPEPNRFSNLENQPEQLILSLQSEGRHQNVVLAKSWGNLHSVNQDIRHRTFEADQNFKFYAEKSEASVPLKLAYFNENEWESFFEMNLVIESLDTISDLVLLISDDLEMDYEITLIDLVSNQVVAKTANATWELAELSKVEHRFKLQLQRKNLLSIEDDEEKPSEVKLFQNYPNPFNPTTFIRFELYEATSVQVDVFDNLGRVVYSIGPKYYSNGMHQLQIEAGSSWQSGIYFYRLQLVNGSYLQGKMTLVK